MAVRFPGELICEVRGATTPKEAIHKNNIKAALTAVNIPLEQVRFPLILHFTTHFYSSPILEVILEPKLHTDSRSVLSVPMMSILRSEGLLRLAVCTGC